MNTIAGNLQKMQVKFKEPIEYTLQLGESKIHLNEILNTDIGLQFLNEIFCVQCGKKTSKSFQQGHCYPCYLKLAECSFCIIHPERCHYPHQDCPDHWAHQQCKQSHIIYLANSSGLKIGITRESSTMTRWIDQGAIQALPLFNTNNRFYAGLIEVIFKNYVADKTQWRALFNSELPYFDLMSEGKLLISKASSELAGLQQKYPDLLLKQVEETNVVNFQYPILHYPSKAQSLSFEKMPLVKGKLLGIKGQYLILSAGVINIRKYSGYKINFLY